MLTACEKCGLVVQLERDNEYKMTCPRCSYALCCRGVNMLYAFLFSITSLLFTIPAILFPFLIIDIQGFSVSATIFESAKVLNGDGFGVAAIIVILTSFIFPVLFMIFTAYLSCDSMINYKLPLAEKAAGFVNFVRHWQMVDVFLVGILVSIVKLVSMADIKFGTGFYMLSLECFFMILAGTFYDNRLFWYRRKLA